MMLRLALRRLSLAPAFTAFSIATLALGIGVTTALYSALLGLNHRTVGVRDPERVVTVRQIAEYRADFSGPEVADLRAGATGFDDIASVMPFGTGLAADGRAALIIGEAVSGNYFQLLGVRPAVGRLLRPADDRPDASPVVVLSDESWRQQFNRDPAVIGRTVRLGGRPFEVVGIAPRGFNGVAGLGARVQALWAPVSVAPGGRRGFGIDLTSRDKRDLTVIARLASGVTSESAASRRGAQAASAFTPTMDAGVLMAAGGFALLSFLIATVSPALQHTRSSDRTMLASDTGAGVAPKWRGRANLIALQVWVSVCLFLLTALGVRMILDQQGPASSITRDDQLVQVDLPFELQKRDETTARRVADRIVTDLRNRAGQVIEGAALRAEARGFDMTLTRPDRPFVDKVNDGQRQGLRAPHARGVRSHASLHAVGTPIR